MRQPEFNQLFDALDVRVWAKFEKVRQGKRLLNKFDSGLITTGNAPWPIEPYNGPRNGSSAKKRKKADIKKSEPIRSFDRADSDSSQKANRGDWQNLEPSVAVHPYVTTFLHPPEPYILRIGSMMHR